MLIDLLFEFVINTFWWSGERRVRRKTKKLLAAGDVEGLANFYERLTRKGAEEEARMTVLAALYELNPFIAQDLIRQVLRSDGDKVFKITCMRMIEKERLTALRDDVARSAAASGGLVAETADETLAALPL